LPERVRQGERSSPPDRRRYLRQYPRRRTNAHTGFFSAALFSRPEVEVSTLVVRCPAEEIDDPNAVKVVTALDGRALYFSRSTIPYDRNGAGFVGYRKHLGIYAYHKAALEKFASLPPSIIERTERLEQLRLLDNGINIYVAEAPRDTIGVDTEEDLLRAEAVLNKIEQTGRK
jgi:3-deoxy-manno-octulosonate cytidylyltransferase (CMP-KDO synthetase)